MKPLILLLSVILAGCAAPEKPYVFKLDNPTPLMPATLKQPCGPIPELPEHVTMGDLVEHYNSLINLYTLCRLSNQAKIDWASQNKL